MQFVDVTFDHAVDYEANLQSVGTYSRAFDDRCGLVDFGAAVVSAIDVSVGLDLVGGRNFGRRPIQGFSEGQVKSVRACIS